MKLMTLIVLVVTLMGVNALAQESQTNNPPRILIAYFTNTNNTKAVAEQIRSCVGGDIFRVTPLKPYPLDVNEASRIARVEQDNNARPLLATTISQEDMKNYDVIFYGYPNWWATIPMAMFTFLEQYDFSGKTIIPFCTHEGSGLGRGPSDIAKLAPGATLRQGLAIRGSAASRAQTDVDNWLRQLGYIE